MEDYLTWNEQYNVGVAVIDREHKKLFSILNKLFHFGHSEKKGRFACQESIKYFKDHAIQHFADEEAYMASINYPGLEIHKRIHRDFRERMLPSLENELELTDFSGTSIHHFLDTCAEWLIGHTLIEDHMIVNGESIKHWENLLSEEDQAVMGQTIASLLHSMLRLDSQLISSCYAGEKLENGIYCRFVYTSKSNKRCDFLLLFEKQLVGSAIGNIINTKSETTDKMLSSVAKYVGRQLIERVNQRSFSLEEFRILREQLLTYEQFYRTYERQSPQFSLLFNTGRGYFAYCMTSSEMPRRKDSLSAIAKNAVSEIEERLRPENTVKTTGHLHFGDTVETIDHLHPGDTIETIDHLYPVDTVKATEHLHLSDIVDNEVSQKKKILVVDDSDFMRKSMLDLLGRDYEVLTASSGTSAIRRMTLARPDLVLLDYEMPVCNGIQVLEMIRSEKDFTDIPIIFLTCRVDRESVKKVISFKPDGYLSKSLPAKSLKNEIDHFFEKKDFYN